MRVFMKDCRCADCGPSDPHSSKASRTTTGRPVIDNSSLWSDPPFSPNAAVRLLQTSLSGSSIKYLKCNSISALPGSTFLSLIFSTTFLMMIESHWARSKAIVRQQAAGSLRETSSRLQKKLEPYRLASCKFDTNVEAIVDLPAPGLPVSKRMLGT